MKKRTIAVSFLLIGAAYAAISRLERRIDDRFGETGFPQTDDLDRSGEPYRFEGEPYGFEETPSEGRTAQKPTQTATLCATESSPTECRISTRHTGRTRE